MLWWIWINTWRKESSLYSLFFSSACLAQSPRLPTVAARKISPTFRISNRSQNTTRISICRQLGECLIAEPCLGRCWVTSRCWLGVRAWEAGAIFLQSQASQSAGAQAVGSLRVSTSVWKLCTCNSIPWSMILCLANSCTSFCEEKLSRKT
jgi:hypothetical protein